MNEAKVFSPVVTDREVIKDKIRAAIFGYAIGDTLGKGTEFMTVPEVKRRYPEGLHEYDQIIRDAHRSQWKKNQWTMDTDHVIRAIECILEAGGIDYQAQALSLKNWYHTNPTDGIPLIRRVSAERDFLIHPHAAARRIAATIEEASNEALGAALFAALHPEKPAETAADFSGMTHANSRCLGAAGVIGLFGNSLLWYDREPSRPEVERVARRYDERIVGYVGMAYDEPLNTFSLDDEDTLWFARKSMAAGIWPIAQKKNADEALFSIIAEGGDADTNTALALALIGLRDGFKALPVNLIETIANREQLEDIADRYSDYLIKQAGL